MKKESFLRLMVSVTLLSSILVHSQSRGSIAFTAFNVDGDDDFSIVALQNLPSNTIIYFTDYEWEENTNSFSETGSDGFLKWNTGNSIIEAGTIITFTDLDNENNVNFGSSIGTLTSLENIAFLNSGETIFAYTGSDQNTPTIFLTGIKNGSIGLELMGTGIGGNSDLSIGIDFLEFNPTNSPDGGYYNGSRSNQTTYMGYLPLIVNKNNWIKNTSEGELILPFSKEAFTTSNTTWLGTTDDWSVATNWDNGVPTKNSNASIPNTNNHPKIKTGTFAVAGNITINTDAALTVHQNLSTKGIATINSSSNSYGVLKVTETFSGIVKYNKHFTGIYPKWSLISSPVDNNSIVDFATQNDLELGSGTDLSQNIALSSYDNSQPLSQKWIYYTVGETDHKTPVVDTTDKLISGQGYSASLNAIGDLKFIGTLKTEDVTRTITTNTNSGGSNFNLVGNPYPTYVNCNTFLTTNSTITNTIWLWDEELGTNGGYITKNLSSNYILPPGQGFFVEANNGTSVLFEKTNQSIEASSPSQKQNKSYIKIFANTIDDEKYAEIYYLTNATTQSDNGYDSTIFGDVSHPFAIYSQLVSNNQGENLAIQSLPNSNYENMIIPIGINAPAGKEITFSAETINLPLGINLFLEDRENAVFKKLNGENLKYRITTNNNLSGIGRFYLYTTQSNLSTKSETLGKVSIYKENQMTLKIVGLPKGKAFFSLHNTLGKEVLSTSFIFNGNQKIDISKLTLGVYIIKIKTSKGIINKKIIL